MARQTINIGTSANKGDGDPLRTAFDKINDNFAELYAGQNTDPANTGASLIPDADGTRDLGSRTKRWADAHIKDFIYLNGTRIEVDGNGVLIVNGSTASQRADLVGDLFGQDSSKTFDSNTNTFYGNFVGTLAADDSTVIVDGVNGTLNVNLDAVADVSYDPVTLVGPPTVNTQPLVWDTVESKWYPGYATEVNFLTVNTLSILSGSVDMSNAAITLTGATYTDEPWISLADLKTVVSLSTDFTDFQTRIAAL